ncbi:tRNA (adenosine(37)-N6)-threonylcarbamoyltransferase complex ATPase subunit type 1 TsaE [Teredinibacter purpureus]|uniref:tRNA (adenosine(37)-N6)-threonylcarbamoyltransferase complex ATPase subunit type 1 TsaE n=1 Tax=Teredinibacter purpureus TaxID=2731756 RepID=UPI0005F7A209|nr:tRNA (adenosine(37)-N6)-threonylcarbamoyltransferase complex ATPase subunit type 1 TsaE [Teredinibacter purpureus]
MSGISISASIIFDASLVDEAATVAVGRLFGAHLRGGAIINLDGVLGAGKTTFCRGILNAFGYSGAVKSPTYTLVEPYEFEDASVFHFDLYRLGDPEELEYMGIRDYFQTHAICLIEWPTRGEGFLPAPDLTATFTPQGEGRALSVCAHTARGIKIVQSMG